MGYKYIPDFVEEGIDVVEDALHDTGNYLADLWNDATTINALDDIEKAAEQAGIALATIGTTVEVLGKQLTSLLKEAEELITIKRLTPRDESDLWEGEKERLDALREKKTRLENRLASMGVSDTTSFTFDIWDYVENPKDIFKAFKIISKLSVVNKAINEILYQEPGVVTNAIYNVNEVLERLNTIEQPKIEDILDSLDDNLEATEVTVKEINKLFVTKKRVPLPQADLSKEQKDKLKMLELDARYYQGLIGRKDVISSQLMGVMDKIPAKKYEITDKIIKVAGVDSAVFGHTDANANIGKDTDVLIDKDKLKLKADIAGDESKKSKYELESDSKNMKKTIHSDVKVDKEEYRVNISKPVAGIEKQNIEGVNQLDFALSSTPKHSMASMQPHGAMISASFNTKFDGYQRNYANFRAQTAFYHRELFKIDRKFDLLKYRWEEEPGVIPQTLDELKGILEQFRNEEQPRIDTVLDTLNENLEETRSAISKIDDTLDFVPDVVSSFNKYSKLIKIGLAVFVGVVFLDFVVAFFVLLRMALGL